LTSTILERGASDARDDVRWAADQRTGVPRPLVLVESRWNGWHRWRDPRTGAEWNSRELYNAKTPSDALVGLIRDDVELLDYLVEMLARSEPDQHIRILASDRRARVQAALRRLVSLLSEHGDRRDADGGAP
jgi:hypothetical protein